MVSTSSRWGGVWKLWSKQWPSQLQSSGSSGKEYSGGSIRWLDRHSVLYGQIQEPSMKNKMQLSPEIYSTLDRINGFSSTIINTLTWSYSCFSVELANLYWLFTMSYGSMDYALPLWCAQELGFCEWHGLYLLLINLSFWNKYCWSLKTCLLSTI